MTVPNRLGIVEAVNQTYPHLLRWNTDAACGEFLQRVVREINARHPSDRVGLLTKPAPGAPSPRGYTFPNGQKTAIDVIAFPDGSRVDIISGADAHPAPGGPVWQVIPREQWRASDTYIDVSGWPLFDSATPRTESTRARLGRGWFCMLRAFQDWPAEATRNWDFLLAEEDPDIFRVMFDVEGARHIGSVGIDVWRDAGVDYRASWWRDRVRRTLDLVGDAEKRVLATLYGGRERFRSFDEMRRYHDAFVDACRARWAAIWGITIANEYNVNGWTEDEVQRCGVDVRSKLPAGMPLALSSPDGAHGDPDASNEAMLESFERLYGPRGSSHFGATFIDIHKTRVRSSRWANQFAYNPLLPELKKADSEPFGQGASTGGDVSDVALIANDYRGASEAGFTYYMAHNAWSVWNGHMPAEWIAVLRDQKGDAYAQMHAVRSIADMPNQRAISNALRDYRRSGKTPDGEPAPPPAPTSRAVLRSGEALLPDQSLVSPDGSHHLRFQGDGNLVVYAMPAGTPVWASGTSGHQATSLQMNADGNLVLYDADGPYRSTRTWGHEGAMVQLQDDGNFVVYDDPGGPNAGTALWDSATGALFGRDI